MVSPEALRRYHYFAEVCEESLREVAMISDEEICPPGRLLFRAGDRADYLYIITEGEVDLQYTLGDGQPRTIDTAVAGELIMWSALVEPYRSTAAGITRSKTRLVAIRAGRLRELCLRDHGLGYRMMLSLVKMFDTRLDGARVQLATAG